MEKILYEAAIEGSVISLISLLNEDPLVLDRFMVSCDYNETPLHIASMLGHLSFVNQILDLKPEITLMLDSKRNSSLHLAAAKGYVEIVKALMAVNPNMCLARDQDGRIPLHIAAIKGRVTTIRELVHAKPESVRVVTNIGETVLHLCVKYGQLESLMFLMEVLGDERELINHKNDDGNTILHLAVIHKQTEVANILVANNIIDVNAQNIYGLTSLDIIFENNEELRYTDIVESLKRVGGKHAKRISLSAKKVRKKKYSATTSSKIKIDQKNCSNSKKMWAEKTHTSLMVVSSLIATMAFQAGVTPPGGVWQENNTTNSTLQMAGESIAAFNFSELYHIFLILNTIGFISSVSVILLLISGLPLKKRFFIWILMVIMWVAINSMALAYLVSIAIVTPNHKSNIFIKVAVYGIITWVGLMSLFLVAHTIRLIWRMIRKVSCLVLRKKKNLTTTTGTDHILVIDN